MADLAYFKARFPEFVDPPHTDALIQLALDDAALEIDEVKFADSYDLAHSYLAAHYRVMANEQAQGASGPRGPLVSKSIGDISATYKTLDSISEREMLLSTTSYGQRYMAIRFKKCHTAVVTNGGD